MPHLVVVKIKTPIANEPLIPIKENKKFWLAIGDSITQGMVAKRPSFTYPVNVARVMGYELLNWGVGGDSFNAKLLDFVGREPDLITIALGCNDWDHFSLNEIQKNATDYVEKLCSLYKCRNIYGRMLAKGGLRSKGGHPEIEQSFCPYITQVRKMFPA